MKLLTLFLIFMLVVFDVNAITGSVGNAKVVLRPEVNEEKVVIDRIVKVENVNNVDVKVTLTPDQILEKFSEVIDKEFVLKPGESKDARFRLNLVNSGTYTGRLYVKFSEVNNKGPGVVLSSTVTIIASGTAPEFVEPEENYDEVNDIEEDVVDETINSDVESNEKSKEVSVVLGSGDNVKGVNLANPLVGFFIILFILVLGVGLLLIFERGKK